MGVAMSTLKTCVKYERSHVAGPDRPPLPDLTVGQALLRAVESWPDGIALIVRHQGIRWTWSRLFAEAEGFAAGLLALGLRPGDRIGILAPNNAEWIVAQYATARAGLILVNINPAYRQDELSFALRSVGCKALITAERFKGSDYPKMLSDLPVDLQPLIHIGKGPKPGMIPFADVAAFARKDDFDRLGAISGDLKLDMPINIQFTSGTTGAPKAATLSHRNIVNNAYLVAHNMRLGPEDRLCIPVPMYHCFGMVLGSLAALMHGTAMVFASEGFDARAVLEAVAAERVTALHGVPTMFIAELDEPGFEGFDLSSLRTGVIASAPCPVELMKRIIVDMHLRDITIAYGMTETGPVSFQTAIDDSLERRVETVGRVLPHTEVKIVDEHGAVVPVDTPGELLTRGYCVMTGYWENPEKTAEAIDADGWIHSGDIATIDSGGYCRIVGRLKDMLIRGGENIFPREIEEFLYGHPKIDQVEVFGVPDPKYGEEVCAWIKLHDGESADAEEIREYCRGHIAHFKIPKYIRFVEAFPMTVTGKVQKFVMRRTMSEELGPNG